MLYKGNNVRNLIILVAVSMLTACQSAPPTVQTGQGAEVTFDGLHRVDNSVVQYAWLKPDLSLAAYSKIKLVGAGIEYRAVRSANPATAGNRSEFPLTDQQKMRLESMVAEVFQEELGNSKKYSLTSEEGPDVLELTGALIDVVSRVPPERGGRGDYYISSVGSATLVLELRDSQSNEILARAIDGQAFQSVYMQKSSSPHNAQEVKRGLRKWGRRLTEILDQLHGGL